MAVECVAGKWPRTTGALGLHPWHAGAAKRDADIFDRLDGMLSDNPDFWVGEIGLDGLRAGGVTEEEQDRVFIAQLRLATKLGRRVNLHCVKAWHRLEAALRRDYLSEGGRGGFIVHSFAGPHQSLFRLAGMGAYFTVGPLAWRRGSRRQEERMRLIPLERILLESDAFLTPGVDAVDDMGKTLEWLAGVRDMDAEELAAVIEDNVGRMTADG